MPKLISFRFYTILSSIAFLPTFFSNAQPVEAQKRHANNYGMGIDLNWYCPYRYGSSARWVLINNSPNGWKCAVGQRVFNINWNDACQAIYGSRVQARLGNPNDRNSWYCTEAVVSIQSGI